MGVYHYVGSQTALEHLKLFSTRDPFTKGKASKMGFIEQWLGFGTSIRALS